MKPLYGIAAAFTDQEMFPNVSLQSAEPSMALSIHSLPIYSLDCANRFCSRRSSVLSLVKPVVLNLFHCRDPLNATDVVWDPQVKIEKKYALRNKI